jgi:RNA polymerase sigma factor (TIGR02999 family)
MRQNPEKRLKKNPKGESLLADKENCLYSYFAFDKMSEQPITHLLQQLRDGKLGTTDELLPIVYDELRSLAKNYLSRERSNHTLQPTALVHEAYVRLIGQNSEIAWENRAHFFGVAARLMREVLIDYARARNRQKRGGEFKTQIALDAAVSFSNQNELDIVAVDDALTKLENLDERQGRIVEMKFFGGMTIEEIAEVLSISAATVKREWSSAKLLLYKMLND